MLKKKRYEKEKVRGLIPGCFASEIVAPVADAGVC